MHIRFLALGSLACILSTLGCAPVIVVEGGASEELVAQDPIIATPPVRPPTNCKGPELHVVGIYDPYDSASNKQGPAHVHIERHGPVKLFLSSYSATDWTVTTGPATQLIAVVAHAYEAVTVNAPAGVPVDILNTAQTGKFLGCGYEVPDKDPFSGCETPELLTAIEQQMQQPVRSFHGCYAASDFVIDAQLGSSSNCATEMGYEHTSMVAACAPASP